MTESEWLTSDDPASMLRWVTCAGPSGSGEADLGRWRSRPSDRKLRLFACACCRAVWPLLADPRSRRAVEVAERYADGGATVEELRAARNGLGRDAGDLDVAARWACLHEARDAAGHAMRRTHAYAPGAFPKAAQAALLRDVVGNPWRPASVGHGTRCEPAYGSCALDSGHPGGHDANRIRVEAVWLTPAVAGIAQRIYDDRDFAALPVLADALEEAGCEEETLLRHLRGWERDPRCAAFPPGGMRQPCWVLLRGPHVRGCWAIDAILSKG